VPRRVDEDNGAASEAVVLWRAGDSSAGQDDGPEACYPRRVFRIWSAASLALATACVSAEESPAATLADAAALILVHVGPQGTRVEVVEPFEPSEQIVLEAFDDSHTYVLAYDRALSSFGLRMEGGELVQRPGGVPLPPPARWLEAVPDGPLELRSDVDTARDLPEVRVPGVPCPTLEEDVGTRLRAMTERIVTFVGPAGEGRYLLGLARDQDARPPKSSALALATPPNGDLEFVDLALNDNDIRGFVASDQSIWIAALTAGTTTTAEPILCHFRVGGPYDSSACRVARGVNGRFPLERLAGYRGADGRVVLVGMSWDWKLATWTGTDDGEGEWSTWIDAGKWEQSDCSIGAPSVSLWVDGPGTGVAAPESGPLLAFDLLGPGPRTQQLFEDTSCLAAFARTPAGAELFARVPKVAAGTILLPPPDVHWRGSVGEPWQVIEPRSSVLEARGMLAVGNVVLMPSTAYTVTPLVFDHRRPDLPPRTCSSVSAYNTAASMVDLGGGRVLIGGTSPNRNIQSGAISTWTLVE
jgi:hypothetical protein